MAVMVRIRMIVTMLIIIVRVVELLVAFSLRFFEDPALQCIVLAKVFALPSRCTCILFGVAALG